MENRQSMVNPSGRPAESFKPEAVWLGIRLLRLVGGRWPDGEQFLPRQILLQVADAYDGEHHDEVRAICQGFYLMSHRHYEPALQEFEQVLEADAAPELARIGELALEGHAFCLQNLERGQEAAAELLYLILGKLSRADERMESELAAETASLLTLLTRD